MRPHILHNGLHRIGDQPNHFIDQERFLGRPPYDDSWLAPSKTPRTNILAEEKYCDLEIAFPSFTKEDISLSVEQNILKVKATKEQTTRSNNLIQQEFSTESLERTFQLSEQIDTQNVEANFNNGLLSIRLRLKPDLKTKRINVV